MVKHLGREELVQDGSSSKSPPLKRICQNVQVSYCVNVMDLWGLSRHFCGRERERNVIAYPNYHAGGSLDFCPQGCVSL